MVDVFVQISLLIILAVAIAFLARLFKQPLIIAYIAAGILAGPIFLNLISDNKVIDIFSQFGIAFLLFVVGLSLSPKVIKEVGKASLVTGLGQIAFTLTFGYLIASFFGFPPITALYIAVALCFSSTIIIMKLLSDKEDLERLYGKISIGFLLVQDLVVILILMAISASSTAENLTTLLTKTLLYGGLIILALVLTSIYILPKLSHFFAKSQELLFIFSIGWGLGLASLFHYIGFSIEVGALIAGVTLAMFPYNHEISSKMRPLRDFFMVAFFLALGSQIVLSDLTTFLVPAILMSSFVLIGNPLIVMVLMGRLGYSKKTGFMAGLTVAQISEFSLIFVALGIKVGHIGSEILSLITLVGLITITGSTYMIMYSHKIYPLFEKRLSFLERKSLKEKDIKSKQYDYILLGYNRIGFSILKTLAKKKKKVLVIDFNPDIIQMLNERGVDCTYGDVDDSDLLEELKIEKSKAIISTIPGLDTNLLLIEKIRMKNEKVTLILTARQISEAMKLYEAGADYVILPHFLGGDYTAQLINKYGEKRSTYKLERQKHLKELKERLKEGHEHPNSDKN